MIYANHSNKRELFFYFLFCGVFACIFPLDFSKYLDLALLVAVVVEGL